MSLAKDPDPFSLFASEDGGKTQDRVDFDSVDHDLYHRVIRWNNGAYRTDVLLVVYKSINIKITFVVGIFLETS